MAEGREFHQRVIDQLKQDPLAKSPVPAAEDISDFTSSIEKFHARQGHGFGAERGNDFIDRFHGKNAEILGDNNALNGADRRVGRTLIQSKYCQSARQSVRAAFGKDGLYRYLNNGKPMQLEVPRDQYPEAVQEMAQKIRSGKVPGLEHVKDPVKAAKKLIRKGNLTYKQALNIAKAGRIEGLLYDAAQGAVIAASAFGVSAAIAYAKALWDGQSQEDALACSLSTGVQVGGAAFASTLLTGQLTRLGAPAALRNTSETLVRKLPAKARQILLNTGGGSVPAAAKLLRDNALTALVMTVMLSAEDIKNAFEGKISGKQLFKNMCTLAAGIGGGFAGGAVTAAAVAAIIGTGGLAAAAAPFLGSILGGTAAGVGTNKLLSCFIEDDAVMLVDILKKHFIDLAEEYLLSEEEVQIVLDDLQTLLDKGFLLVMFAVKDRDHFADTFLRERIERTTRFRACIRLPGLQEYMAVLTHQESKSAPAVKNMDDNSLIALGEKVTGQTYTPAAVRKALYVTRQMNAVNQATETVLRSVQENEKKYLQENRELIARLREEQRELNSLLEGME